MSPNIKSILEELYSIEPTLREKEDAIIRIIESMQQNRPEIKMDEAFKNELRERVMSELQDSRASVSQDSRAKLNWGWVFGGLSTATLAGVLIFTIWNSSFQEIPPIDGGIVTVTTVSKNTLSFAPVISSAGENAFGASLTLSPSIGQSTSVSAVSPMARGMGGGGGVAESSKIMGSDAMMVPPMDFPYYTYVYTGSLLVHAGNFTVYKKNPGGFTSADTASFLSNFLLDGMDLSAFESKTISSLSFSEEKDFGYIVNVDFQNGNVSLYQNWTKWPQVKCDANGCEELPKITEKDVPSDDEFIRIADEFLEKYGIDRSLYGTPKVDGSWRIMYARAIANNQEGYIPDQYNVSYPLVLEGKNLYEEYGGYKGISLTIDVRTKKVTGMYGLERQNLVASAYTTPVDESLLKKLIQYGGRYETKPYEGQKTVEITLGDPTIQYVHVYGEYSDGKAPEYYVPAYVFPVINKPEGSYLQDTIILPAVQDFATFVPMMDTPVAVPMPVDIPVKK